MSRAALPLGSLLAFLVAGCAVGPDYQRPEVETPAAWRYGAALPANENPDDLANLAWWTLLQDPVLDTLIADTLRNNRDLRIAAARIEEAAGILGTTRAQLFPQVGANLGASSKQLPETTATQIAGQSGRTDQLSAALNVGWEIDLFGKFRRANEASQAELLASEENRRALLISLASTVANAYISLRDLDNQLDIAKKTLQSREQATRIFELRYRGGVVSDLEISQVRSELETARVAVPIAEQLIAQQESLLSALSGRLPGSIARGKSLSELLIPLPPANLPSSVLARRPDIRQAEQVLIANNARIGVARAAYFPTLSLTGMLGGVSTSFSSLFSGPAATWSAGADLAAPIFTAGSIAGQVKAAEARQVQALEQYRKTIEYAFREVDDAMIGAEKSREIAEARIRQVNSLVTYANVARLRYESGYSAYIEVLDAERTLFQNQINESQARAQALISSTTLYKALGGGWAVTERPDQSPEDAN